MRIILRALVVVVLVLVKGAKADIVTQYVTATAQSSSTASSADSDDPYPQTVTASATSSAQPGQLLSTFSTAVLLRRWAAPIAGDCKYCDKWWNEDEKIPYVEEYEHADPDWLSKAFQNWKPPMLVTPRMTASQFLNGTAQPMPTAVATITRKKIGQRETTPAAVEMVTERARRHTTPTAAALGPLKQDTSDLLPPFLQEYFGNLPRKRSPDALVDYVNGGADLVHQHLRSPKSPGSHEVLHQAIRSILDAHDGHQKARHFDVWKRMTTRATEPADGIIESVTRAVLERAEPGRRQRMETFVTSGMTEAVWNRASERKTSKMDEKVLRQMFERVFGPPRRLELGESAV